MSCTKVKLSSVVILAKVPVTMLIPVLAVLAGSPSVPVTTPPFASLVVPLKAISQSISLVVCIPVSNLFAIFEANK